jgi:hypothetical protein
MTRNQIAYWELMEKKTNNRNTEFETQRSNMAREHENERHNKSTEQETQRHNLLTENLDSRDVSTREKAQKETERHNRATENLNFQQNQLGYAQLAETKRKNTQDYALGTAKLNEQMRANRANESIETGRLAVSQGELGVHQYNAEENVRHNQNMELINLGNMASSGFKNVVSGVASIAKH